MKWATMDPVTRELNRYPKYFLNFFVKKYDLPCQARVTSGWNGKSAADTVAMDEILTIYCAREDTFIVGKDRIGRTVRVPDSCKSPFLKLNVDPDTPASMWTIDFVNDVALVDIRCLSQDDLPMLVVVAPSNDSPIKSTKDFIRLDSFGKEDVVIAYANEIQADNYNAEEIIALPITLNVELLALQEIDKRQYDFLDSAVASVKSLTIIKTLGTSSDEKLQTELNSKLRSMGDGKTLQRKPENPYLEYIPKSALVKKPKKASLLLNNPFYEEVSVYAEVLPPSSKPSSPFVNPFATMATVQANKKKDSYLDPNPPTVHYNVAGRRDSVGASHDTKDGGVMSINTIVERLDKAMDFLSVEDVSDILQKLNLEKYVGNFQREQIDGSLLSSLDASMLENDLGVTSKLHQTKILTLVKIMQERALF